MIIFIWKPEYSVGIKNIDNQHKKLIDTINMLHEAVSNKAVLNKIFDNLVEYTTIHFATEEDLMVRYSYPDYLEHKGEHDKCISKVAKWKTEFDKGKITLTLEMVTFLIDWIHSHLLEMDQKYSSFFKKIGLV